MPGTMAAYTLEVQASCAICGAPPVPECPHEGERLEIALNQAMQKWMGYEVLRSWVVDRAREQVLRIFHEHRRQRLEEHHLHMQSLPYHSLYHRYNGRPPLAADQIQQYQYERQHAEKMLKQFVDQDWKTSCLRYPEILDYYFSLVEVRFPSDHDVRIAEPRFGDKGRAARQQDLRRRPNPH